MPKQPMFFDEKEKAAIVSDALEAISGGCPLLRFTNERGLNYTTVWNWLNPEGGDNSAYARAREIGTHALVDECIDISDSASVDNVQVARTQIDTRLRIVGKWNRRDYGDKQEIDHRSSDGTMSPRQPLTPEAAKAINDEIEGEF